MLIFYSSERRIKVCQNFQAAKAVPITSITRTLNVMSVSLISMKTNMQNSSQAACHHVLITHQMMNTKL